MFSQLKVHMVEVMGEPRLVFCASATIDVREELLFNYNDTTTTVEGRLSAELPRAGVVRQSVETVDS